jgi:DNA replication and repair protein RecF
MYLQRLTLANFKNYTEAELEFCKKINCFVGENGEGKTNILDAIHYLSFCKSYFNNIDSQNIRYNQTEDFTQRRKDASIKTEVKSTNLQNEASFFSIIGIYQRNGDREDIIQCAVKRGSRKDAKTLKQFKLNRKEYERLSEHIGLFPLVMISPSDNNMIYEGSDERRKYIDGVISQFDKLYLQDLISYNKALEQRNKLLKMEKGEWRMEKEDLRIEIWDEQLIRYGQKIFDKRQEFIQKLIPIFSHYYKFITGNKERVSIEYDTQLKCVDKNLRTTNFKELLQSSINKDKIFHYTTAGIHKDDILFNIEDRPLKKFGSQGQQKSFLIALKLAQFDFTKKMKGYKPILLFDDIFDKLDDPRVEKLINLVSSNNFGQIFITETHKDRILKQLPVTSYQLPVKIWEIKKGQAEIINEQ